jgi:putative sigma-54 modulation protein
MKVSYTGIPAILPEKLQAKIDRKFAKLAKLLDGRGEKTAHVIVGNERHLNNVEITVPFYDHQLVGIGSDGDLFTAMSQALAKLEKQALKQRERWREGKRRAEPPPAEEDTESASSGEPAEEPAAGPQVFRVNHHERRKPMSLEEALLQMEDGRNYLVYRDIDKQCLSVLVRRPDGNFDLIES